MSADIAIRIDGLSKVYNIAEHRGQSPSNLREAVVQRLRRPFRQGRTESFWALKNINTEIRQGEVVGFIGRNGAGKSTLLKVLSRITEPTLGRIELYGRVGSLLEVGTGFHPELSGRENIYLNGAILGMQRSEITGQFDAIVDFAGVEKFLDTPVKRYSSGMYVRLAFAVAAHLNPEILIVDEVLAVGDAEFQKKCLGKMKDVADGGRTVLFVSHNMDAVVNLCTSTVMLQNGTAGPKMNPRDGVQEYLTRGIDDLGDLRDRSRFQLGERPPIFVAASVTGAGQRCGVVETGDAATIEVQLEGFSDVRNAECGIMITDMNDTRIVALHSRYSAGLTIRGADKRTIRCCLDSLPLMPGRYAITLAISDGMQVIERVERAKEFDVVYRDKTHSGRMPDASQGLVTLASQWELN